MVLNAILPSQPFEVVLNVASLDANARDFQGRQVRPRPV